MTEIVRPLHIATIRGHQLRFFRTPNNDGKPDFPWHCCEDLYRCMGLARDLRRHFQRHMSKRSRTVATIDGLVTIAPHCVAQGATSAWREIRGADIESDYSREVHCAVEKLVAGFPPGQALDWAVAAFKRHDDARING